MQKRVIAQSEKKGLSTQDILLVGVLLAAGAVLKFFVGSMFTIVKPNFVIAMYALAILLIRPKLYEALIIGLLAGAICQFFPGTPYINLISEPVGALVMVLLMKLPLQFKRFSFAPIVGTFLSTLASGFTFIAMVYVILYTGADVEPMPLQLFFAVIFGTAAINTVIVQLLYLPLNLALRRNNAGTAF